MVHQRVMATWRNLIVVFLFLGFMAVGVRPQGDAILTSVKGGFWPSWSSNFAAPSIDANVYTHLFYAFALVDNSSFQVIPDPEDGGRISNFSETVKAINPDVKTLIAISASSNEFLPVLATRSSRLAFIKSSISLARSNGFDGLDLDFEFPSSQEDMNNLSVLFSEWREAVIVESRWSPLLLTAAVYYKPELKWVGEGAYPIQSINLNLDFVNIMSYDFHGTWDVTATGANTNLYDPESDLSVDAGLTSWLDAGLLPEKAVLGFTLYGRSWILKNQSEAAGLNAPAVAAGPSQPFSQTAGVFFYSEVKVFIAENNATVVHDEELVTAYCYANNVWVSYEDPLITTTKVNYVISKNLRGYFFWAINQDSDWEVSTAASEALGATEPAFPPTEAPRPAMSSATRSVTSKFCIFLITVLLPVSVLFLPFPERFRT